MRLFRITLAPVLGAAGLAVAGLLTAPAHAAGPATSLAAAPADLPTYICRRDLPRPPVYPPIIFGSDCQAGNGAPTEGVVSERVRIIVPWERPWICEHATAIPEDEDGGARVIGHDCFPEF
ncbi:hypothetical protein [Streptomyces sporangiiformans]|uniref:Secreted protein n=1 Tax=Streptomyces sporangiiformans TaxID=2315329 RepID=A0A505DJL1_9ACTN|nr:hypothetical protein [Streptomyces sporangiiformans]TPQ17771.1 hypothetical protein FGD71_034455 [Streptomyces sporangiiformans]